MWSQERIDTLRQLWLEGLSASQISKRLGNVTRNAVIGKVHRMGLYGRTYARTIRLKAKPAREQPPTRVQPAKVPKMIFATEPLPDPRTPIAGAKLVSILEITDNECKYPHGDGPFQFCGCPAVPGLSYCASHARIAFRPVHETPIRNPTQPAVWRDRIIDKVT